MIREDKIPKHVDTNICSEYNVITKLIAVRTEVSAMKNEGEYYKQKIIEMINEMDNIDYLFKVYHYIIPKYKKEKGAVD